MSQMQNMKQLSIFEKTFNATFFISLKQSQLYISCRRHDFPHYRNYLWDFILLQTKHKFFCSVCGYLCERVLLIMQ